MKYNLDLLKNFNGIIKPSTINMAKLVNMIEAEVSQYRYFYHMDSKKCSEIIIEVTNANIPHLLGLSKLHHHGLPTYNPSVIFEGLKSDWSLENLIKADKFWFAENQDKIIGLLLLYQIFHIQQCKFYTTNYIVNKYSGSKYKRDNIYFVMFKAINDKSYTLELSPKENTKKVFFPRSLKINDKFVKACTEIDIRYLRRERIRTKTSKIKPIKWKISH
ncbi:hypothetical protein [uncultured Lactobacillus sp.]|uniref:hypothetical protein n=1 Tax=uncultured Lactobacillus sp. TaxID=153152 RepID=UPI0025D87CA2|nr:hypothetical protein [uncultured Lactobacillus sp.]